jgi:hypothetical protein
LEKRTTSHRDHDPRQPVDSEGDSKETPGPFCHDLGIQEKGNTCGDIQQREEDRCEDLAPVPAMDGIDNL